jgi:hypothetical protein
MSSVGSVLQLAQSDWLAYEPLSSRAPMTDMAVFDALRHLSTYLSEAHVAGKHHLADLYEIVQYAGNILPVRLRHARQEQPGEA